MLKKTFLISFLVVGAFADTALKTEVNTWLKTVENGIFKVKYDSLSQDKQNELDTFFEECRKDVASGKLPKGTCKPEFIKKLKGI